MVEAGGWHWAGSACELDHTYEGKGVDVLVNRNREERRSGLREPAVVESPSRTLAVEDSLDERGRWGTYADTQLAN